MQLVKTHNTALFLGVICVVSLILFRAAFNQFFSADDWFHLRISNIATIGEFANFFRFKLTDQSAAFYRPIPTQVFFFLGQRLFGLNAIWWYGVVFMGFWATLVMLYRVTRGLFNHNTALLSTALYAVSHTHATRLYFLSAFQEISLVFFTLCAVAAFLHRTNRVWWWISVVAFCLALLSKETAVIVPGLLALSTVLKPANSSLQSRLKDLAASLWPHALCLAAYLYLRFAVMGLDVATHETYAFSLDPQQLINTGIWYGLWSLGAPETLSNYVVDFSVLARWWSDFGRIATPILWLLGLSLLAVAALFAQTIVVKAARKRALPLAVGVVWFALTLLPVVFFPNHKFALELGLPLVGSSWVLATLIADGRRMGIATLVLIILLNVFSSELTATNHYSILRSQTAQRVYKYFMNNHPRLNERTIVRFTNDRSDLPSNWGVSKQISESLQGSEFFAVLYPGKSVLAEYEDLPQTVVSAQPPAIVLGSSQFLY